MISHTANYTVSGTGRAECTTQAEFDDLKATILSASDKFTITNEDEPNLVLEYSISITVNS